MASQFYHTVTKSQWALFVWMVDNCEKKQNNACKGCGFMEDCIKLYQHVSNICISNRVTSEFEHENQRPSPGNPQVECGYGTHRAYKRARRDVRLSEGIGI